MFNAASFDTSWDFWVLALLVALLLPGSLSTDADTEPPRGRMLFAARLAAEGAR